VEEDLEMLEMVENRVSQEFVNQRGCGEGDGNDGGGGQEGME